jgi:hypothetical protein
MENDTDIVIDGDDDNNHSNNYDDGGDEKGTRLKIKLA